MIQSGAITSAGRVMVVRVTFIAMKMFLNMGMKMTKSEILKQIETWESEADSAEKELRYAEEMCRMYYKMLDDEELEE